MLLVIMGMVMKNGRTLLIVPCNKGHGYMYVFEALLKNNADLNLQDIFDHTPLIYACRVGQVHMVDILLKNNADINLYYGSSNLSLIVACSKDHLYMLEMLLKENAK